MKSASLSIVCLLAVLFVLLTAPPALASGGICTASPSNAVLGTVVKIVCSGFDPNAIVNTYVVEPTGFTEWGHENYGACMINAQGRSGDTGKANEKGDVTFNWYTQNGANTCPITNYGGYANQIGTYIVVVQQLDGIGGIKTVAKVAVTLSGTGKTFTGAMIKPATASVNVGKTITFMGSGFMPNEPVNLWFTRPAYCAGFGTTLWTGVSAFDPGSSWGIFAGLFGPGAVTTDSQGNFAALYAVPANPFINPCLGQWMISAQAPGSKLGATATFMIQGNKVANNAMVWTVESSVPSTGYITEVLPGVGVHVSGSGFPANAQLNCWLGRPDGTVYRALVTRGAYLKTDAAGNFANVLVESFSAVPNQSEQPGIWTVTCGTPDQAVAGSDTFLVFALLDP